MKTPDAVAECLARSGPSTVAEIAAETWYSRSAIQRALARLALGRRARIALERPTGGRPVAVWEATP